MSDTNDLVFMGYTMSRILSCLKSGKINVSEASQQLRNMMDELQRRKHKCKPIPT